MYTERLPDLLYRYRGAFNHIAAVAIVDGNGTIIAINERFEQLYGYAEDEAVGKPIGMLKSRTTLSDTHRQIWKQALAGETWCGELLNTRKDGSLVWVRCTVTPSDMPSGKSTHAAQSHDPFLVMYQDIHNEVGQRKNREALAIEEARQALLAGTLHNIGNLQTILDASNAAARDTAAGLADACAMARSHKDQLLGNPMLLDSALGVFVEQAQRVSSLASKTHLVINRVSAVLDSFREIQRNVRTIENVTPLDILRDAIESFSFQAATRNVRITLGHHRNPASTAEVSWPVNQLHQVLFNLLKNAMEAIDNTRTSNSGYIGRIDLSAKQHETQPESFIVLNIRDNGGGFRIDSNKLFSSGSTTKPKGLGLGLHNSSILIRGMGGKIEAEPATVDGSPGAVFKIVLPIRISEHQQTA